jgi:hypothetical protein
MKTLNGLSQITLCNIYSKMELPLISGFILVFPYRLTNSFTITPFLVCLVILTCRTINSNKRFYTLFITLNHHLSTVFIKDVPTIVYNK